jgi:hypothetical protein
MGQCVLVIDLFSMELYTCEQDEEHNYKGRSVVNKSHDFVIGQPTLKSKPD